MSQTISRPTSNTRKPTMKIHPSVVIDLDASAMADRVEGAVAYSFVTRLLGMYVTV
jgi:hypothetical protein